MSLLQARLSEVQEKECSFLSSYFSSLLLFYFICLVSTPIGIVRVLYLLMIFYYLFVFLFHL